ncbi:TlpA disulfide reductase family protein [Pinibacter soli]|uniref:TlpA disulfide reductase family protein n=1 Tax=Pinibacter soli TaxID=3044211 RepID=A0ABT6RCI4_9BACT|nr:TlpA disulfide reductase family protein [Pinibacter soli]MDI3320283.1 TlpA disulfide reductase family protein [Pinibacter soli]
MKKSRLKCVLALALPLAIPFKNFANDNKCTVSGNIAGLQQEAKVFVIRRSGEHGLDTVARSMSKPNGDFSFDLPSTLFSDVYELRFAGLHYSIDFIAEKGTVAIKGNKDKLYTATVTGTPENDRLNQYHQFYLQQTFKRNDMMMSKTASREEKMALFKQQDDDKKHYTDSIIRNYPSSLVALYMAKEPLPMMKFNEIDSMLTIFKPYFPKHKYYLEMKERADVLRKVGSGVAAPDFTAIQPDGSKISLSSFKGKYVLLDFWASWCVPCRAENKHTKSIYEKFHPYGLELISFSLDSDLGAWKKAIEKDGLVWHNASDLKAGKLSPVAQKYGIDGLPAVWIIDPNGKIIAEGLKGEAIDKMLETIFSTK